MTGGMAFEGLNNLGHSGARLHHHPQRQRPLLRPHRLAARREPGASIRTNPTYVRRQARLEQLLARTCRSSAAASSGASTPPRPPSARCGSRRRSSRRSASATPGPFDGHDIAALEEALRNAAELRRPARRARAHPEGPGLRAGRERPDQGHARHSALRSRAPTPPPSPRRSIKEAEAHPELVAITAAMPDSTGLLPFGERFPDRCFDVGIAEQHAVTAAAGMAMGGLRPVVAIYSTFLTRAFDQVNLDVGLHEPAGRLLPRPGRHHRRRRRLAPRRARHGAALQGAGHDDVRPVVVPGAPGRCSTTRSTSPTGPSPSAGPRPPPAGRRRRGRPRPRRPAACARAPTSASSASARCSTPPRPPPTMLAADGVSATVWDARVVKPLDPAMLADAARHPLVVTVEDGLRDGGIGIGRSPTGSRELTVGEPEPPGARARHADRVHPPRQARRHPRRARPRRRRHRRLGPVADGRRPPARRLGLIPR